MASGEQWDAETMRAAAVFPNHPFPNVSFFFFPRACVLFVVHYASAFYVRLEGVVQGSLQPPCRISTEFIKLDSSFLEWLCDILENLCNLIAIFLSNVWKVWRLRAFLKAASCEKYCHSCASDIKEEHFIRAIWFGDWRKISKEKNWLWLFFYFLDLQLERQF